MDTPGPPLTDEEYVYYARMMDARLRPVIDRILANHGLTRADLPALRAAMTTPAPREDRPEEGSMNTPIKQSTAAAWAAYRQAERDYARIAEEGTTAQALRASHRANTTHNIAKRAEGHDYTPCRFCGCPADTISEVCDACDDEGDGTA